MAQGFLPSLMCPLDWAPLERALVRRPFPTVVDRCTRCRGAFVSALDFHAATQGRAASAYPEVPNDGNTRVQAACVACGAEMGLRQGPAGRIASCPSCEGVWLFDGELSGLRPPRPLVSLADAARLPAEPAQPEVELDLPRTRRRWWRRG